MIQPNDPMFLNQHALQMIHVPEAWEITTGSASVEMAQFDTGCATHPDLAANVVLDGLPPFNTFGTWTAGIVAATANNNIGISGVCQHLKLHTFRTIWSEEHLAESLTLAKATTAKVGLTGYALSGWSYRNDFEATLNGWSQSGQRIIICPIGDTYSGGRLIKGQADPRLFAIGACNLDGTKASWSNYGRRATLWAPGHAIVTDMGGSYASTDTTKVAAALVAGVAGLVLAVKPSLTGKQVRDLLVSTATPMACGPVVNALAAVEAAAL